jgi:hypothetical protein
MVQISHRRPITKEMPPALRATLVAVLVAAAALLAGCGSAAAPSDGTLRTLDGDTIEITATTRAEGMRFAADVAPGDRAWILAAIGRARSEAGRLIDEVDGLVEVRTDLHGRSEAIGLTEIGPAGVVVSFDVARLDASAALQRDTVVLHELGHVVDAALVPRALGAQLNAGIPSGGACAVATDGFGACAAPEERFADTFAKWALRGAVSAAGAGYAVAAPASLEDWGAPLTALAVRLVAR